MAVSLKVSQPVHKQIVNEMVHCIAVTANFEDGIVAGVTAGQRTWVAIKLVCSPINVM